MIVENWTAALKGNGKFISSRVESVPNGQKYGKNGYVPCTHTVVFEYEHATVRLRAINNNIQLERQEKGD